ncbi:MAG: hypothetical protein ACE5J9_09745 [Methanosarcinales archaeon]
MDKGKKIYNNLKSILEPKYKGKIIAIEVDSGGFVIGEDELDAALKAKELFPNKIFAFMRIGYPVVHKFRKILNIKIRY